MTKCKNSLDNPGQNISRQVIIIPSPCPQFQCWNDKSISRTLDNEFGGQGFFDFISDTRFNFFQTCLVICGQDCTFPWKNYLWWGIKTVQSLKEVSSQKYDLFVLQGQTLHWACCTEKQISGTNLCNNWSSRINQSSRSSKPKEKIRSYSWQEKHCKKQWLYKES